MVAAGSGGIHLTHILSLPFGEPPRVPALFWNIKH
jgi:hypothetical protein